VFKRDQ